MLVQQITCPTLSVVRPFGSAWTTNVAHQMTIIIAGIVK
jgi:uncharacterized membrane protein